MLVPSSAQIFLLSLLAATPLSSAVIGMSKPAESITIARIATLPAKERAAWTAYLERSQKQMQIDKATLAAERTAGAPEPPLPKEGFSARSMPLNRTSTAHVERSSVPTGMGLYETT